MDRLLSRKLWLTIGAFITFAANGLWTQAMGVVLGYLGVQGVQDIKESLGGGTTSDTAPANAPSREPEGVI